MGMMTARNVLDNQAPRQIVEHAARRAWAQQDYMGTVSLAMVFCQKPLILALPAMIRRKHGMLLVGVDFATTVSNWQCCELLHGGRTVPRGNNRAYHVALKKSSGHGWWRHARRDDGAKIAPKHTRTCASLYQCISIECSGRALIYSSNLSVTLLSLMILTEQRRRAALLVQDLTPGPYFTAYCGADSRRSLTLQFRKKWKKRSTPFSVSSLCKFSTSQVLMCLLRVYVSWQTSFPQTEF